jgi:HlyD family secretion protein
MRIAESKEAQVVSTNTTTAEDPYYSTRSGSAFAFGAAGSNKFNRTQKKWLPIGGAVLLTVAVIGGLAFSSSHSSQTRTNSVAKSSANTETDAQNGAPTQGSHASVLTVSVQIPTVKLVERELDTHGTVAAWDPISVGATASGLEVKSILVDEGQLVGKGQLLAILDSDQLRAQLQSEEARFASSVAAVRKSIQPNRREDINSMAAAVSQGEANVADSEAALVQAKANAENSLANTKRYQMLVTEGAVSIQEAEARQTTMQVDEAIVRSAKHRVAAAKASLKQGQERLSMAKSGGRREDIDMANASVNEISGNVCRLKTQIEQTLIKAPVDGLITRRDVHLGDISTGGKPMFLMTRDNRLELKAQVPESDLQLVTPGQDVVINNVGTGVVPISGRVREISPLIDSDLRLATVRIDLPFDCGLKPGMYSEGQINVGKHSALTVPSQSVISRDDKNAIFILHGDQVERRMIQLGSRADKDIEVTAGVKSSERVVVDGAGFLKDGDYVSVAKN